MAEKHPSAPSFRQAWVWMVLALVGLWSVTRFHGLGACGSDIFERRLVTLKCLDGQGIWHDIWWYMSNMGRFQHSLQLLYSDLYCLLETFFDPEWKWWGPLYGLCDLLSLAIFSWGLSRRVASPACGFLAFLFIVSGLCMNTQGHLLFSTWPCFIWVFAILGLALAARSLAASTALFFLAATIGNESMLAFPIGLALGHALTRPQGTPLRRALWECRAPLYGSLLFLICYFSFRHVYPSRYDGNQIDLSHPCLSLRAWGVATCSQLPGYDFVCLAIADPRRLAESIRVLLHNWTICLLVTGFPLACAAAALFLGRQTDLRDGAEREKRALLIAFPAAALLNFAPLAITPKYIMTFNKPLFGLSWLYSFYGYVWICAALALAVSLLGKGGARRLAAGAAVLFVCANDLVSGFSGRFFLRDIRPQTAIMVLFERFAREAPRILPPAGTCHIVENLSCVDVSFYKTYFETAAALNAKRGRSGPVNPQIDFLENLPAHRNPGERYFWLSMDWSHSTFLGNLSILRCAEIAPEWNGRPPLLLRGPLWIWVDSSYPRRPGMFFIGPPDGKNQIDLAPAEKGGPLLVPMPALFPDFDIVLSRKA